MGPDQAQLAGGPERAEVWNKRSDSAGAVSAPASRRLVSLLRPQLVPRLSVKPAFTVGLCCVWFFCSGPEGIAFIQKVLKVRMKGFGEKTVHQSRLCSCHSKALDVLCLLDT